MNIIGAHTAFKQSSGLSCQSQLPLKAFECHTAKLTHPHQANKVVKHVFVSCGCMFHHVISSFNMCFLSKEQIPVESKLVLKQV